MAYRNLLSISLSILLIWSLIDEEVIGDLADRKVRNISFLVAEEILDIFPWSAPTGWDDWIHRCSGYNGTSIAVNRIIRSRIPRAKENTIELNAGTPDGEILNEHFCYFLGATVSILVITCAILLYGFRSIFFRRHVSAETAEHGSLEEQVPRKSVSLPRLDQCDASSLTEDTRSASLSLNCLSSEKKQSGRGLKTVSSLKIIQTNIVQVRVESWNENEAKETVTSSEHSLRTTVYTYQVSVSSSESSIYTSDEEYESSSCGESSSTDDKPLSDQTAESETFKNGQCSASVENSVTSFEKYVSTYEVAKDYHNVTHNSYAAPECQKESSKTWGFAEWQRRYQKHEDFKYSRPTMFENDQGYFGNGVKLQGLAFSEWCAGDNNAKAQVPDDVGNYGKWSTGFSDNFGEMKHSGEDQAFPTSSNVFYPEEEVRKTITYNPLDAYVNTNPSPRTASGDIAMPLHPSGESKMGVKPMTTKHHPCNIDANATFSVASVTTSYQISYFGTTFSSCGGPSYTKPTWATDMLYRRECHTYQNQAIPSPAVTGLKAFPGVSTNTRSSPSFDTTVCYSGNIMGTKTYNPLEAFYDNSKNQPSQNVDIQPCQGYGNVQRAELTSCSGNPHSVLNPTTQETNHDDGISFNAGRDLDPQCHEQQQMENEPSYPPSPPLPTAPPAIKYPPWVSGNNLLSYIQNMRALNGLDMSSPIPNQGLLACAQNRTNMEQTSYSGLEINPSFEDLERERDDEFVLMHEAFDISANGYASLDANFRPSGSWESSYLTESQDANHYSVSYTNTTCVLQTTTSDFEIPISIWTVAQRDSEIPTKDSSKVGEMEKDIYVLEKRSSLCIGMTGQTIDNSIILYNTGNHAEITMAEKSGLVSSESNSVNQSSDHAELSLESNSQTFVEVEDSIVRSYSMFELGENYDEELHEAAWVTWSLLDLNVYASQQEETEIYPVDSALNTESLSYIEETQSLDADTHQVAWKTGSHEDLYKCANDAGSVVSDGCKDELEPHSLGFITQCSTDGTDMLGSVREASSLENLREITENVLKLDSDRVEAVSKSEDRSLIELSKRHEEDVHSNEESAPFANAASEVDLQVPSTNARIEGCKTEELPNVVEGESEMEDDAIRKEVSCREPFDSGSTGDGKCSESNKEDLSVEINDLDEEKRSDQHQFLLLTQESCKFDLSDSSTTQDSNMSAACFKSRNEVTPSQAALSTPNTLVSCYTPVAGEELVKTQSDGIEGKVSKSASAVGSLNVHSDGCALNDADNKSKSVEEPICLEDMPTRSGAGIHGNKLQPGVEEVTMPDVGVEMEQVDNSDDTFGISTLFNDKDAEDFIDLNGAINKSSNEIENSSSHSEKLLALTDSDAMLAEESTANAEEVSSSFSEESTDHSNIAPASISGSTVIAFDILDNSNDGGIDDNFDKVSDSFQKQDEYLHESTTYNQSGTHTASSLSDDVLKSSPDSVNAHTSSGHHHYSTPIALETENVEKNIHLDEEGKIEEGGGKEDCCRSETTGDSHLFDIETTKESIRDVKRSLEESGMVIGEENHERKYFENISNVEMVMNASQYKESSPLIIDEDLSGDVTVHFKENNTRKRRDQKTNEFCSQKKEKNSNSCNKCSTGQSMEMNNSTSCQTTEHQSNQQNRTLLVDVKVNNLNILKKRIDALAILSMIPK